MPRVGISLVPFGATYTEVKDTALAVEDAGFESVWTWDHSLANSADPQPVLECWTFLAALAEATSRVKLGSFVTNVMNRHPDVLANIVATVHQISEGRVELGIGAGGRSGEQLRFGRSYPRGIERVNRVREAVELIRLLWSGETVDYQGQYYQAKEARCASPPRPSPRIMVAGQVPDSARNAARVGDGWNCDDREAWMGQTRSSKFFQLREVVLEELELQGRSRESFEISIKGVFDEGFRNDPLRYLSEADKNDIDRVILNHYPPFDRAALTSVGKILYG